VSVYLYVILAYLLVLTGYNIYRSRQIKSQEDFMVAGRSLSLTKMVFTLVCTWIGSGTFIAGAEFASYAGWSAVWQPAGRSSASRSSTSSPAQDRTFAVHGRRHLEVRHGVRPVFGAIALIIAFTTIVAYQFRRRLHPQLVTDGAISLEGARPSRVVRDHVRDHRRHGRPWRTPTCQTASSSCRPACWRPFVI
jgi:SSS family solute:Na+ symporter/sodium/proline symporter